MIEKTVIRKEPCKDVDGVKGAVEYGIHFIKGNHDAYFTLTARFGSDRNGYGGACHEAILKVRPDLKPFADLHLSDTDGAPMYPVENGLFWAGVGRYSEKNIPNLARHLRISEDEAARLIVELIATYHTAGTALKKYIDENLAARWKTEADELLKRIGVER